MLCVIIDLIPIVENSKESDLELNLNNCTLTSCTINSPKLKIEEERALDYHKIMLSINVLGILMKVKISYL